MAGSELLLIDKPAGITSFDVIRRLRRVYSELHAGEKAPKMGHAGTLDPAATGLMLIGVGAGTKKLTDFIKLDKEYEADILLGVRTTTGDRDGEVVETVAVALTADLRSAIATAVTNLTGTHTLPVSAFSAIKKDGVKMYKRAYAALRRGETITDIPTREMTVYSAELLQIEPSTQPVVRVHFYVASGTYVRSLAEELGRQLRLPASLAALRRTKVGEFRVEAARTIDEAWTESK